MKIFVLNNGSSSLKYQLLDMPAGDVLAEGLVEKIGFDLGLMTHKYNGNKLKLEESFPNHKVALERVVNVLTEGEGSVIGGIDEIEAVGHRVVHGGEYFSGSVIATEDIIDKIEKCEELAPLHNRPNKEGILVMQEILPNVKQVAVLDTAFHSTMKKENFIYPIPLKYYEEYKIRRYGFHGTSHHYVYERTCEILGVDNLRLINCHVGNGGSVCAVIDGKVVETSMGFTPLEGLIMGTRSGDIDPSIIPYIMKKEGLTIEQVQDVLSKESGLKAFSGDSDLRTLESSYLAGDEDAIVYMNIYVDRIVKYIGSYFVLMGGADVITLTAGVMENAPLVRKLLVNKLSALGIKLDESKNDFRGEERTISTEDSKVKVMVVPTNEEYMIAKETYKLVS